jgi:hypothetical protein
VDAFSIEVCAKRTSNISNVQKLNIEVVIPHMRDPFEAIK